jgi:hypothetical protein
MASPGDEWYAGEVPEDEPLRPVVHWGLFAIAIFCMAVAVVGFMLNAAQLVCVLMGWCL